MIHTMTKLVKAAMEGADPTALTDGLNEDGIKTLYQLAKGHDMVHLLGGAMQPLTSQFPDNEYLKQFKKQFMIAVLRYEKLRYELSALSALFEEEKLPYLPLKGSVLREYYPEPWMRTSCDIDILIHEEDVERATAAITEKLNYQCEGASRHDVSFFAPSGVHFELHFTLIEDDVLERANEPLSRVWDNAYLAEGTHYQYRMTGEMFYYFHIVHMAKHFLGGGCGVKPYLDITVIEDKLPYDEKKLVSLLTESGLLTFFEQSRALAAVWFRDAAHTDKTQKIERYLMSGGTYGNLSNMVAMKQTRKGGKFRYLLSRLFVSFDYLASIYPGLKKHRWLYPFYQVRRWFRPLFHRRVKQSFTELKATQNTTAEEQKDARELLTILDLHS